jgi:NAD(P)-dependent dehydrogenase (short-subunit alcohol dehydrogenase family)
MAPGEVRSGRVPGKAVIVTGGARGMGEAHVRRLASEGADGGRPRRRGGLEGGRSLDDAGRRGAESSHGRLSQESKSHALYKREMRRR